MPHVYVSTVIHAPIDHVWGLIGDFNSLPAWHPWVADCKIEDGLPSGLIGCVRAIEVKEGGGTVREQLVSLSNQEHFYQYVMLGGPMPVRKYLATMSLLPITHSNETFAQWEARFDTEPADQQTMIEMVTSIFRGGFASVEEKLARVRP